ncbi:MAG TPA: hypothetical protein VFF27_09605 [Bacteroidia bacterium]|jgi:hypothetical protein|nr:hypothetical protein [Bacteroidia bacterium]
MDQERINFNVVRDFSELFNTTVKFFRQNFKHFFQSIIFIAGPLVLIAAISMAGYQYAMLSSPPVTRLGFGRAEYMNALFQRFGWSFAVYIFFSITSNLVLITTVYSYMLVYAANGPKNFGVAEVRKAVWQNIGRTVKGFFALVLLFFGICLVIGIIAAILGGVGLQVLIVFLFLGLLLVSPPFVWQFSTFYLVKMKDDVSSFDAMAKTREVMRGSFFSTWLYIVVVFIALIVISIAFSIPQTVCQVVFGIGQVEGMMSVTMIITMITQFFVILIYGIFYFMCGLHYYSLAEKKDGTSLIDRIDEIGNTPTPDVEQHY